MYSIIMYSLRDEGRQQYLPVQIFVVHHVDEFHEIGVIQLLHQRNFELHLLKCRVALHSPAYSLPRLFIFEKGLVEHFDRLVH